MSTFVNYVPVGQYYYTEIGNVGYRWNMLQRIKVALGFEPVSTGDTGGFTVLIFSRDLTEQEKTLLDGVMADNPTYPPVTTNTVYQLKDIWETREEFSTKIGTLPFNIYYTESVLGSNVFDRIELHFKKVLGAAEKNKVQDEQSKLMTLKQ